MRQLIKKGLITKNSAGVKNSFQMRWTEVKTMGDGKIRIKGFASTPDIDRYDDIVNPAAFANAMTLYMMNPVVLLGHDSNKVLGKVVEYNLSNEGLEVTAELSNDIDNTFHNIMEKNLRGFSIGFICKGYNVVDKDDRQIREITSLDLVEISVVSTPANASSLFTLAKSLKLVFAEYEKKSSEEEEHKDEEKSKKDNEEWDCPECKKPLEECTCNKKDKDTDEKKSTEDEPNTPSKTEDESKETETPPPPKEEVPGDDKSTPVKAEEKTPETPQGISEEEAKSLIENAIKAALIPLQEANTALTEKNTSLEKEIGSLKELIVKSTEKDQEFAENYQKHFREFKKLEEDFLNIEIRPGGVAIPRQQSKGGRQVTDAMILKSLGI